MTTTCFAQQGSDHVHESEQDGPTAYWAAFGYQNHLIPVHDEHRASYEYVGLCGVKTSRSAVTDHDRRPTCSVCAEHVREGRYCTIARP